MPTKSQETTFFSGRQKLTSAMKLRPEKVMVYFQIRYSIQVSLHREPPEVGLLEKLSGSLYWWVELGVPSLHRECSYISISQISNVGACLTLLNIYS